MSQQESIRPRQATRLVTATRRQEMAGERARILGQKRALPSALEVAAAPWEKEREAGAKEAPEAKLRLLREAETHPFSLQQVALQVKAIPGDDAVGWKAYMLPREAQPRRRRLGGMAVGSFATRLIQRERAGGGAVMTDPRARALEEAARRWEEERKVRNPRREHLGTSG